MLQWSCACIIAIFAVCFLAWQLAMMQLLLSVSMSVQHSEIIYALWNYILYNYLLYLYLFYSCTDSKSKQQLNQLWLPLALLWSQWSLSPCQETGHHHNYHQQPCFGHQPCFDLLILLKVSNVAIFIITLLKRRCYGTAVWCHVVPIFTHGGVAVNPTGTIICNHYNTGGIIIAPSFKCCILNYVCTLLKLKLNLTEWLQ